jgi:hypothetical protein
VKQWVAEQLGRRLDNPAGVLIILDPEEALGEDDITDISQSFEIRRAATWVELRRLLDSRLTSETQPLAGWTLALSAV